jgi:mono/diheme cytochrome c family protein
MTVRSSSAALMAGLGLAAVAFLGAFAAPGDAPEVDTDQILRGRQLVMEHACGACHGGLSDPAADNWLIGMTTPEQESRIGPCYLDLEAEPCFRTRPRNLTPDNRTGMGRFSERQIFNALRYGLRPGETEDVEITSMTPGMGNFPEHPKYLAPPMPWPAWRYMPDEDLWAIAAYLKHGLKPVSNRVADSEGPPDFWASDYAGLPPYPAVAFPAEREAEPAAGVDRDRVLRGRQVVIQHDCGGCHGGSVNPDAENFVIGAQGPGDAIPLGACIVDPEATPCFVTQPANLTPDEETGTGRYTDRQLFNALRFGLRPGNAPDAEITSTVPGEGGFPAEPDYLAPSMPWYSWRHMSDDDLWAVIAYLKHGLEPVEHAVPVSDVPEGGWADEYTPDKIGTWPAAAFPTDREHAVSVEGSGNR